MMEFTYKGKQYRIENIDEPGNDDACDFALIDVSKINDDAAFDDSIIAEFNCNFYDRVDSAIKIIDSEEL